MDENKNALTDEQSAISEGKAAPPPEMSVS